MSNHGSPRCHACAALGLLAVVSTALAGDGTSGADPRIAWVADPPRLISADQANEEAEHLFESVMQHHPDPFSVHGREAWDRTLRELRARTGEISVVKQYFDLSRLLALGSDTHLQLYPDEDVPGFRRAYPVRFRLMSGRVIVAAADTPYREFVGAEVRAVGGTPIDQVVETLADHAFSDNRIRQRSFGVEYLLRWPATYAHFGWQRADGHAELDMTLHGGGGGVLVLGETEPRRHATTHASGQDAGYFWPEGWATLQTIGGAPPPLSRSRLTDHYWYTYLAQGEVLYYQLNTPLDQQGRESLLQFNLDLFDDLLARETRPRRLIVDLRHNLGGDIFPQLPFVSLAAASGYCCGDGRVVVLTANETISAGSVFVGELERTLRAVVVGEPTGGRPNLYLGKTRVELPHSGLGPAEISLARRISTDSSDTRLAIYPDREIPEPVEDVIAGSDPALEAALALSEDDVETCFPDLSAYLRPWTRPSQSPAKEGPRTDTPLAP